MVIRHHISLKPYNTFGIDVKADTFAVINDLKDLSDIFQSGPVLDSLSSGEQLLVLGEGSNVLFTGDFQGLVLKVSVLGMQVIKEDDGSVVIRAGAGEKWDDLVRFCIEKGYGGLENLSGIPGCVGASPIQNIGAYGTEMKECFVSLEAIDLTNGRMKEFKHEECRFGYRDSVFKNELKGKYLILSVTFRLSKNPVLNLSYKTLNEKLSKTVKDSLNIGQVRKAVLEIRSSRLPDPAVIGNAGSFFKNPVVNRQGIKDLLKEHPDLVYFPLQEDYCKIAAGWLIDRCGWKGHREGNVGVYKNQALVMVNYGKASGPEILNLAMKVRDSVRSRFGILLEPEVQIW